MGDLDILKQEKGDNVYYTIPWSILRRASKFDIIRVVPAMGGIAELYYADEQAKLNLFCVTRSWYGGLRSSLRELTDPEIEKDPVRRQILLDYPDRLYYRYALTESLNDMNDILFFFMETYAPDSNSVQASGRYANIFVKEIDPQKLVTI